MFPNGCQFLAHHAPLMFVAGLGTISPAKEAGTSKSEQDKQSRSRSGTVTQNHLTTSESTSLAASTEALKLSGSEQGNQTPENRSRAGSIVDSTLQTSFGRDRADSTLFTRGSPNPASDALSAGPSPTALTDEFEILKDHLRKAFHRDSGKAKVWPDDIKPDAEGKVVRPSGVAMSEGGKQAPRRMAWRTVLVDKVRILVLIRFLVFRAEPGGVVYNLFSTM
jgi:hypothetical protein